MLHVDTQQRRPPQQARGGAHPLPGDRLRAALPRARRLHRAAARRPRGSMPTTGIALRRALPRLPARCPGQRPLARHRHDRRQGRPQQAAARAGQRRQLRAHRRAQRHRASSSRAPRRSSPARPTCTSSWSCPAATWARPTPTSRSAAPCPCDADGVTIVARPGRPARREGGAVLEHATASRPASSSSTASSCPGSGSSWPASGSTRPTLTYSYATHHRHTCIAARAGFGDLLIGAGALMCEANGFDPGAGDRTCASRWCS